MKAEKLRLPKEYVLVEPIFQEAYEGRLILPDSAQEMYPQVGWVVRKGELTEEIEIDDIAIFSMNAVDMDTHYYDVCYVELWGEERLILDPGYEPMLKEIWRRSIVQGETYLVTVQDLEGDVVEFATKHILEFGTTKLPQYEVRSKYPNRIRILWIDGKMYYYMHQSRVLVILESW